MQTGKQKQIQDTTIEREKEVRTIKKRKREETERKKLKKNNCSMKKEKGKS